MKILKFVLGLAGVIFVMMGILSVITETYIIMTPIRLLFAYGIVGVIMLMCLLVINEEKRGD